MIIRLKEMQARMTDKGTPATLDAIAAATGIQRTTLDNISRRLIKEIRLEYIDALCAYFGVSAGELLINEPADLPLNLNIRPDRRGKRVGQSSKPTNQKSANTLRPTPDPPTRDEPADWRQAGAFLTVEEREAKRRAWAMGVR